jgi:hypothetical protein
MSNVTINFVATPELKSQLEQWAKDEDRTMSATLRRILEAEAQRREAKQTRQEVEYQTN